MSVNKDNYPKGTKFKLATSRFVGWGYPNKHRVTATGKLGKSQLTVEVLVGNGAQLYVYPEELEAA